MVFGEWLSRDNNVWVLEVPEEFFENNDASLVALTLEPAFNFNFDPEPFFQLYEIEVPFPQASLRITAVPNDPNATVNVNEFVPDETSGVTINLQEGRNEIGVIVRAANGLGMRLYGIIVTRAPAPAGGSSWPSRRRFEEVTPVEVTPTETLPPVLVPTVSPTVETPSAPSVETPAPRSSQVSTWKKIKSVLG